MSATTPAWKVAIKKGDILSTTATYDTSRASWYEVMGIMVVGITDGPDGGVDPFTQQVDQTDRLTHGRLPENIERGVGKKSGVYNDPRRLRRGPFRSTVVIRNFTFSQGDLTMPGRRGAPVSVRQGQQLTFVNQDKPLTVRFHTITTCKLPCDRTSGIKFPLADGPTVFDSGELGYGLTVDTTGLFTNGDRTTPITAAVPTPVAASKCATAGVAAKSLLRLIQTGCVGTTRWKTPKDLSPGTYTYFCRVHPFMRGAFRVVPKGKGKT
jgi:plastocyanin